MPVKKKPQPTRKTIKQAVDDLGYVKAQIADLEKKEAELRQRLIDSELTEAEGSLFRATISVTHPVRTDYREIVDRLSDQPKVKRLIKQYTIETDVTVVKVVSR